MRKKIKPRRIAGVSCYSLGEFAKLLNMPRMTVYRWIRREKKPAQSLGIKLEIVIDNLTGRHYVSAASAHQAIKDLNDVKRFEKTTVYL